MPLSNDVIRHDIQTYVSEAIARLEAISAIAKDASGPGARARLESEIRMADRYMGWIKEDAGKFA